MKFKTQWNAHEFPKTMERGGGISLTVPDQTMSIKEIVRRFASGLPVTGVRVPMFNEEEDLPDWEGLDLAERQILLEENADYIEKLEKDQALLQSQIRKQKEDEKEKAKSKLDAERRKAKAVAEKQKEENRDNETD